MVDGFDFTRLKDDPLFFRNTSQTFRSEFYKLGRYLDIRSEVDLLDKIIASQPQKVKYLPRAQVSLWRCYIGIGYRRSMPMSLLSEFIATQKLDGELKSQLVYVYNNIRATVNASLINTDILLTDETYLVVKEDRGELWKIQLGRMSNPNFLYQRHDLDHCEIKLKNLPHIQGLNQVLFRERSFEF